MKTIEQQVNNETLEANLKYFIGSDNVYPHSEIFPDIYLTEGTLYLKENHGFWWLFDVISIVNRIPRIKEDRMLRQIQFWTLTRHKDGSGCLLCERDRGNIAYSKKIATLTSQFEVIRVFVEAYYKHPNDENEVGNKLIMLPTERW